MEKLKMKSGDAMDRNVAKIAALFPHCVTECEKMLMGGVKLPLSKLIGISYALNLTQI